MQCGIVPCMGYSEGFEGTLGAPGSPDAVSMPVVSTAGYYTNSIALLLQSAEIKLTIN